MSEADEFRGLDRLLGPVVTYRRWPGSVKPHHPNTMAQRGRRTRYQRKDVDGFRVLFVISKGYRGTLASAPWPVPYCLVRMKVDQLARDGLVDNIAGCGNCPTITPLGRKVVNAWLAGDEPPERCYTVMDTVGTIGGLPRKLLLSADEIKAMWPEPEPGTTRSLDSVFPILRARRVPQPAVLDRVELPRLALLTTAESMAITAMRGGKSQRPSHGASDVEIQSILQAELSEADHLKRAFWGTASTKPTVPLPPAPRKPHQPRQDRQKRPKAIHWRKRQ